MALPYGVKILHEGWNFEWDDELSTVERVVGIDEKFIYTKVIDTHNGEEYRDDKWPIDTFDDKPYLRSMTSMTEEETNEYNQCWEDDRDDIMIIGKHFEEMYKSKKFTLYMHPVVPMYKHILWLLKNHFDFMGLISKDLAIEVTESNNPYKE